MQLFGFENVIFEGIKFYCGNPCCEIYFHTEKYWNTKMKEVEVIDR